MVEVAFYGDDFTGSTDALAQFARLGFRAGLVVRLPSASELRDLVARYDVLGVAGIARSLPPDDQEAELRPILAALGALGPRFVQYKVCSTADSSATHGSIGRALEVGRDVFGPGIVPILIAQPELGRYTAFSHHFAAEDGTVHRLDRQPTMSTHPTTPMHESDLRRHLADQTSLHITGLHVPAYSDLPQAYVDLTGDAVVLDALTDEHLQALGNTLLSHQQSAGVPTFTIGSGGLSRALAHALEPPSPTASRPDTPSTNGQVLAVSGSQSPRTRQQIARAREAGWSVLGLDGKAGEGGVVGYEAAAGLAVEACRAGVDGVVVHTNELRPEQLAEAPGGLAQVVRRVVAETDVRRVVVAGGDTSGQVLRELGVIALELADHAGPAAHSSGAEQPVAAGVHRCRVVAGDPALHGIEVLLKPGQLGAADLFTRYRRR